MKEHIKLLKDFLLKFWQKNTGNWQIFLEPPVAKEKLRHNFEENSIPSFSFYFMLMLSTIIATLGLLADSTATIIGAMIIAPLMNPIMSLAYAIISGNQLLLRRSAMSLITGILLTILVASMVTHLINLNLARQEIIARSNPNLLDLGVAMAAGAAAAFANTRKSIANALPGVAIAVALVPPLSVVGIGLALGNQLSLEVGLSLASHNLAQGAFLLFITNLVGIIFCACLVFLFQRYGNWFNALKGLLIALISLSLIYIPLDISWREILLRAQVRQGLKVLRKSRPNLFKNSFLQSLNVDFQTSPTSGKKVIYIEIQALAPLGAIDQSKIITAQNFLSRYFNQPVKMKFNVIYYNVYE
jgi:uncharacterized hydrophobic protein (TIGR00271 family)